MRMMTIAIVAISMAMSGAAFAQTSGKAKKQNASTTSGNVACYKLAANACFDCCVGKGYTGKACSRNCAK